MSAPKTKKELDTVVKLALAVFFGSFGLIFGGMYLTRPDRTIPPYSIGAQVDSIVAVHVPGWTSDSAIETLIQRFRKVGRETRDFGPMKIRPTTPKDPTGRYQQITIYIFTHDAWAEPEMLQKVVRETDSQVKTAFEKAVRGYYRLEGNEEEGRIGPILNVAETAATAAYSRELFKGPITAPSDHPAGAEDSARSGLPPALRLTDYAAQGR